MNGVNLKSVERHVAFLAIRCEDDGVAEAIWRDINLVFGCRSQLALAMPALTGDTRDYFAELDAILAQMLDEAANDTYRFSNLTGVELSHLLADRVSARLPSATGHDRFQAMLGAALVAVANVLQGPVKAAPDPKQAAERMVQLSADWLRRLLLPD